VIYDGVRIELGYKPDLIVDHDLVIELKTVGKLLPVKKRWTRSRSSWQRTGCFPLR